MNDESDLSEAISGLKEANSSTPPSSPHASIQSSGFYVGNEDTEADAAEIKRMSVVEGQLMEIFAQQLELEGHIRADISDPAPSPPAELPIHKEHAYPCKDTHKVLPSPPSVWPQAPVMLRPTPNTNTQIRGIRFASSSDYQHFKGFCAGCILPINTGAEAKGKSLVIDFESNNFVGTLLMRIKDVPPPNAKETQSTTECYFDGKKRRFQATVKGKFKRPLSYSTCMTGQIFDRPAGKLPARWIMSSFIKFVSTLAPQLEATIDGTTPKFLTPLCATAHTVLCKPDLGNCNGRIYDSAAAGDDEKLKNYNIYRGSKDIETNIEEPSASHPDSLMQTLGCPLTDNSKSSVLGRQKARKKALNSIAASKAKEPKFDLEKEYTFEFYQHLLLFGDSFALDMGSVIGKVNLAPCTNGQPLKFMAASKTDSGELDYLWSFDIWHESLYVYAQTSLNDEIRNKGLKK